MKHPWIPLLALLAAACSARGEVVPQPPGFPGFPTQAHHESVWAEAVFFTNHKDVFGADLTRRDILPVALQVGVRGEKVVAHRLADDFDPHLYLQDGTVLRWLPADTISLRNREVTDRVAELALRPSLLEEWDDTRPAFLFFEIPSGVRIEDTEALAQGSGLHHELDLLRSLLAFNVAAEEDSETINVGLKAGRWAR